jgi:uncharacterized membrane protein
MAIRIRLLALAEAIRGSYGFVPGLMAMAGLAAGLGLVLLDARLGDAWLGRFEWFYGSRPEGARAVLSTIASSTITVAGVVFSITLAAVTYASGQYGPRLLTNFQRDRGNQATLGTFVATFLYCLVVLRTIRSAEEASAETGGALREAFVPHLAVYGALALAVASIAVLVYFVHHVTDSIHINNVIARIGRRLIDDVRRLPAEGAPPQAKAPVFEDPLGVPSTETGYVEAVDMDALVALACRQGVVARLLVRPGDFVVAGQPLLETSPASAIDPEVIDGVNAAFALGRKRTPLQDLRFGVDELVEIAARALSPGVNDPFTAIACVDWLGAAVIEMAARQGECGVRVDGRGTVRLVFSPHVFDDFVAAAFGQVRPYAARDPNARAHTARTLEKVADRTRDPARRALVRAELDRLLEE